MLLRCHDAAAYIATPASFATAFLRCFHFRFAATLITPMLPLRCRYLFSLFRAIIFIS